MIQMKCLETLKRLLFLFLIYLLPLYAQVFDTTPPTLAHHPATVGLWGQPLNIVAHAGDQSGVKSMVIRIKFKDQTFNGKMPRLKDAETVPVIARVREDNLVVYSGPGTNYKDMGKLGVDEHVEVNRVRDNFYRVKNSSDLTGFVESQKMDIIMTGEAFGVAVPPEITQTDNLSYQIIATDKFGNETRTSLYDVRIVTEKQLAKMQDQLGSAPKDSPVYDISEKKSKPFYAKPLFWLFVAAAGGGTYYYISQKDSKGDNATVNLIISYE